jgi:hypothetical protein
MRPAALILAVAGAALLAFGFWGAQTAAGRHRFDEMDGIIPVAAGTLGGFCLIAAVVLDMLAERRERRATKKAQQSDSSAPAESNPAQTSRTANARSIDRPDAAKPVVDRPSDTADAGSSEAEPARPTDAPKRPLAPVLDALATGAFGDAVEQAKRLLADAAAKPRSEADAAWIAAAASFVALDGGSGAAGNLASGAMRLRPEQRRSLATAAELTALSEAASAGGSGARVIPPLAGEAVDILAEIAPGVVERSGDYPRGTIMADVWMDGAGIVAVGGRLARLFRQTGDLELEARAAHLRAMLATRVMAHYPNEVVPAMNAAADVLHRTGKREDAAAWYRAVLGDFLWLPGEYAEPADTPGAEDRIALEALEDTCRGYLATHAGDDEFDCAAQQRTIREILDRPVPEDEDDA